MHQINEVKWENFEIQTIFDIIRGNAKEVTKREFGGNVALVTATDKNNAFYDFVTPKSNETIYHNTITIHNNGNGVGLAFYHDYNFIATSDVTILLDKTDRINEENAQFVISLLKQQKEKYCYGYKLSNERLKKQKILLPVKEDGTIYFDFMEKYIKRKKKEKIRAYSDYIEKEIENLKLILSKNRKWKEFYLISKEMFFIDCVTALKSTAIVKKKGKYDVVGATSKNNGNIGFLDEESNHLLCKGNCICLIKTGEGSVGEAIYKYNDFIPSNNVCIIRSKWLNQYNRTIYCE